MPNLLKEFLDQQSPPCISLYQPTHRNFPENKQDPIRFRNLLKELEHSLQKLHLENRYHDLLRPFEGLAEDITFWNHTLDGLAILADNERFQVFHLPRSVPELAIVANSFHTKPLKQYFQSVYHYHLLLLDLEKITLFEGNGQFLNPIELASEVPRTLTDALGHELTDKHLTFASYDGRSGSRDSMVHGHGGRKEEQKIDKERFFRVIDQAILDSYSRPNHWPLILVALPEHQALFRKISGNPFLIPEGIDQNPHSLSISELGDMVEKLIHPKHIEQLIQMGENFKAAFSKGLAASELTVVAKAAVLGKVATLLIEDQLMIPGKLDQETGSVRSSGLEGPETDDLLDDLGELVEKKGGQVIVLPGNLMPSQSGLAAIYRY